MSVVEMRLCLDGSPIPLEKKTLAFVDPYNLAEEPDELLPVSLVKFSAGDMKWLRQCVVFPRGGGVAAEPLSCSSHAGDPWAH